ncbi:MAG: RNA methyltransferase [bacterium]|nr:RNA methyltransferase [bacterium]
MPKIYLILDNIRSLHNVGSMFRTADAFGVSKIYLCGYTGRPIGRDGRPVKEIAKTALGAEKSVPWKHERHTWRVIEMLKKEGVRIVALENNTPFRAVALTRFKPRFPVAVMLGNEVRGLSRPVLRRADAIVSIPMHGAKESLNVSIACGIALYALSNF